MNEDLSTSSSSAHDLAMIKDQVNVPAIGLMVVGGLSAAGALFSMATKVIGGAPDLSQLEQIEGAEQFIPLIESLSSGALAWGLNLVVLALAALIIFGGLKMRNLEGWGLAVAASAVSLIPCFPCCCLPLGLVFGIWALVVLFKSEVKAAFA